VALQFPDQQNFARNVALVNGCPNIRLVAVPRTGTGEQRVAQFIDQVVKALTDPLTAKEKESGMYTPPMPPRIIFEGTLDDAQVYFQQTTPIENCRKCPIAKFTDGLPIIIPTEEKVKEMLTGTSHKPEEQIFRYTMNATITTPIKTGEAVRFAQGYYATVEKVAAVAVMSGCKPEYLPAVLAVASAGGGSTSCPGTSGPRAGGIFIASGPFAKEIGMNSGQNAQDVGNPPNMTIGRSASLMTISFGQCITGQVRTDSGNPMNYICFAEDDEGLPPGWETFREEGGFAKNQSSIGKMSPGWAVVGQNAPSSFRGLIGAGTGGIAKFLGVEGIPGPHNYLAYIMPKVVALGAEPNAGHTFAIHLNIATSLYDYGFKKKADIYKWMWDTYYITVEEWEKHGWYDFRTNAGTSREPISGKAYKDLPKDYKLHVFGSAPNQNCIVVADSFADEKCWQYQDPRPSQYSIDAWK
jgi:hypothetical protein